MYFIQTFQVIRTTRTPLHSFPLISPFKLHFQYIIVIVSHLPVIPWLLLCVSLLLKKFPKTYSDLPATHGLLVLRFIPFASSVFLKLHFQYIIVIVIVSHLPVIPWLLLCVSLLLKNSQKLLKILLLSAIYLLSPDSLYSSVGLEPTILLIGNSLIVIAANDFPFACLIDPHKIPSHLPNPRLKKHSYTPKIPSAIHLLPPDH